MRLSFAEVLCLLAATPIALACGGAAESGELTGDLPGSESAEGTTASAGGTSDGTSEGPGGESGDATRGPGDATSDGGDGGGCAPAPICGEPCGGSDDEEAGCCPCRGSTCAARRGAVVVLECEGAPLGTCYEPRPCESACIYLDPDTQQHARCLDEVDTCAEIEAQYLALVDDLLAVPCADARDCSAVAGHCDLGLGECWHPAAAPFDEPALEGLAARWTDLGCTRDARACACDPTPPAAACVRDTCALVGG